MIKMEEIKKDFKVIADAKVAKRLCNMGFHIVNIKPLRGSQDGSAFVYENTEAFQDALAKIAAERE